MNRYYIIVLTLLLLVNCGRPSDINDYFSVNFVGKKSEKIINDRDVPYFVKSCSEGAGILVFFFDEKKRSILNPHEIYEEGVKVRSIVFSVKNGFIDDFRLVDKDDDELVMKINWCEKFSKEDEKKTDI